VFDGPAARGQIASPPLQAEAETVREVGFANLVRRRGIAAHEIGFVCPDAAALVVRARAAIDGLAGAAEMIAAQMSLAKGLEFRAVVVMACGRGRLAHSTSAVADAGRDEAELDNIYETETATSLRSPGARGRANTCC